MINETQASFYAKINAIAGLNVHGHVPQNEAVYPYVVVDSMSLNNNDSDSEFAYDASVTVHVFSKYKGESETAGIQKQIYDAVHRQPLTTASYKVSGVHQEYSEIMMDNDGITRHGVQRYRLFFEPNNP